MTSFRSDALLISPPKNTVARVPPPKKRQKAPECIFAAC